ncbi:MAG TPA: HNH endonuclease family protein [Streptosporangiaceae bacterium]|jgi:hypothetical protein|nr:HNH endonuclease family protein [Streptosporangiaceae bacterium]
MAGIRRALAAVAAAAAMALTVGCSVAQPIEQGSPAERPSAGEHDDREVAAAREDLADLRVATPVGDAGYDRDRFGPRWTDADRNGCDTRNDVLARDLDDVTKRGRCVVIGGRLDDPYTGRDMTFTKTEAAEVQIDHIYPLALAWRMGAAGWPEDKRTDFANDRDNLLAVWGRANQRKGDSGPAEWRPRRVYQCTYAIKFVDVSAEYDLAVTGADHAALAGMLDRC